MSDLSVDYAVLNRVKHNLDHIAHLMKQPGRDMEKVSGDAMGARELAERMDDFGEEWSYGIKQLTKFSGKASDALLKIKKAFEDLDDELAKVNKQGKSEGQGK
ncbi:hypothetical protein AB0I94_21610 [Streptomyces sp. NPDC050147]|uniref:hypothetical protein n=1 Tax=Streptomyces sp. NPDC050147 TaxID=3155513 RepID=UPI003423E87D